MGGWVGGWVRKRTKGDEEGEDEEGLHSLVEVSEEGFLDYPAVHGVSETSVPQIKNDVDGVGERTHYPASFFLGLGVGGWVDGWVG